MKLGRPLSFRAAKTARNLLKNRRRSLALYGAWDDIRYFCVAALAAALLFASCAPHVGVRSWERMNPREKLIYVRSMIGHERVKARKGGNQLHWNLPPEEYVRRIDAAVRAGDERPPVAIFEGMGTR